MNRSLAAPSAGQPIRASFFAELLREIRANRPLPGKNVRTQRTPNGTHINVSAVNASRAVNQIPGLWTIVYPSESGQESGHFDYPYYQVGTRLYRATDEETAFSSGADGIACLIITLTGAQPSAAVEFFNSFDDVQERAEDENVSVRPLYEFKGGHAVRDFRNMPVFGTWEFEQ